MKYIGILSPETNTVVENEVIIVIAEDFDILNRTSFHFSRVEVNVNYAENEMAFLHELYSNREKACKLLKFIPLDIIGFFCTSATILQKTNNIIPKTINGIPCFDPLMGLISACRKINPKKVLLVSPYNQKMSDLLENSLKNTNIPIYKSIFFNVNRDIDKYDLEQSKKSIIDTLESDIDLIIISCTNFRTLDLISFFEKKFGIPVISSNQSLFWAMCKKLNIECNKLKKYGRIFQF